MKRSNALARILNVARATGTADAARDARPPQPKRHGLVSHRAATVARRTPGESAEAVPGGGALGGALNASDMIDDSDALNAAVAHLPDPLATPRGRAHTFAQAAADALYLLLDADEAHDGELIEQAELMACKTILEIGAVKRERATEIAASERARESEVSHG